MIDRAVEKAAYRRKRLLHSITRSRVASGSGIAIVAQTDADVEEFVRAVSSVADETDFAALMVFFSPSLDATVLARALFRAVSIPVQVGCSTAGEIGPFGITEGGAVAVLFPSDRFLCLAGLVTEISRQGFDRGAACATALAERFAHLTAGDREGSAFALTLIDGMSNREEVMVSAFQAGLRNLPHVGGSAGDGLDFRETWIIHDGLAHRDAALLCLFQSSVPFRVFKSDHYEPTNVRLVVTACDAARRVVTEINGAPAAAEYAEVAALDPQALSPMSFAAHPLVVKVAGDHFCRSIRGVEDGNLSFFCAIDNGVVLTLAKSKDMVDSVADALGKLESELDGIDLILGFDCVLRRVEAEQRQTIHRIAELYRRHGVVGFNTYGEQYKAMHINQTFSGIAFGHAGTQANAKAAE